MCRLTAYKGKPLFIGDLIVKPENGLMFQSRDAGWHPGVKDGLGKRNIRVNADGFGVAWYSRPAIHDEDEIEESEFMDSVYGLRERMYESCCFKFITPAWSNRNLKNIGQHVQSSLIFAHIRAGSTGLNVVDSLNVSVAEENCHPFQYRQWTFMHNGGIPDFHLIKYPLMQILDEDSFNKISGNTDSEYIFALFLSLLPDKHDLNVELKVFASTVEKTIACILELCETYTQTHKGYGRKPHACSLNLVVTDGCNIIATRYRTDCDTSKTPNGSEPPSLYYNWGSNFVCEEGQFFMEDKDRGGKGERSGDGEDCGCVANEIVISSAPLSKCDDLVLDTRNDRAVEYPRGMCVDLNDNHDLDEMGHSEYGDAFFGSDGSEIGSPLYDGSALGSGTTRRSRSDTVDGCDRAETYAQLGQWVLMPPNHMLVCMGCRNDPSKVVDVFLHDMSGARSDFSDVEAQQKLRKGDMDLLYDRRNAAYAQEVAIQKRRALTQLGVRKQKGTQQQKVKPKGVIFPFAPSSSSSLPAPLKGRGNGQDEDEGEDHDLTSTSSSSSSHLEGGHTSSSPCPPKEARVLGKHESFPESPRNIGSPSKSSAKTLSKNNIYMNMKAQQHVTTTAPVPGLHLTIENKAVESNETSLASTLCNTDAVINEINGNKNKSDSNHFESRDSSDAHAAPSSSSSSYFSFAGSTRYEDLTNTLDIRTKVNSELDVNVKANLKGGISSSRSSGGSAGLPPLGQHLDADSEYITMRLSKKDVYTAGIALLAMAGGYLLAKRV